MINNDYNFMYRIVWTEKDKRFDFILSWTKILIIYDYLLLMNKYLNYIKKVSTIRYIYSW